MVDAMTGQDAVNVASSFNEALGIDGVVLTKLDGDTRRRGPVGPGCDRQADQVRRHRRKARRSRGVPSRTDGVPYPGNGDVMSLIEKAQQQIDEKEAEALARKMQQDKFDFNDLLDQFRQIQKMGDIKGDAQDDPRCRQTTAGRGYRRKQFSRTEAIILSMTGAERAKPDLINPSRKRRIAAGCGMKVEDVNRLIKQYESMRQMMKQMKSLGKKGGQGLAGLAGMGRGGRRFGF